MAEMLSKIAFVDKKAEITFGQKVKMIGLQLVSVDDPQCTYIVLKSLEHRPMIVNSAIFVTEFWVKRIVECKRIISPDKSIWSTPPKGRMYTLPVKFHDGTDDTTLLLPCSPRFKLQNTVPKWPYIVSLLTRTQWTLNDLQIVFSEIANEDVEIETIRRYVDELSESESTEFFSQTLPWIAKLALELPDKCPDPIPIVQKQQTETELTQDQVASLLANAFFLTFPFYGAKNLNRCNFQAIYSGSKCQVEKFKTIVHYFKRVSKIVKPNVLRFVRLTCSDPNKVLEQLQTLNQFTSVRVSAKGTIEDTKGTLHVDFANKFIGGGVLGHGCVQEEIRFLICTELIVSCLLAPKLADEEALLLIGAERFANYSGYAETFRFAGDHRDETPLRDFIRESYIVAIDARRYSSSNRKQFSGHEIQREIIKAWTGFGEQSHAFDPTLPVATGNWGCGAFRGNVELKFMIQWLSASLAGRSIEYFTFGDETLASRIADFVQQVEKFRPSELYCILPEISKHPFQTALQLLERKSKRHKKNSI